MNEINSIWDLLNFFANNPTAWEQAKHAKPTRNIQARSLDNISDELKENINNFLNLCFFIAKENKPELKFSSL